MPRLPVRRRMPTITAIAALNRSKPTARSGMYELTVPFRCTPTGQGFDTDFLYHLG